jgi:hypothetical protein
VKAAALGAVLMCRGHSFFSVQSSKSKPKPSLPLCQTDCVETPFFPLLATLGRIWIDIEDEVPSKYYSAKNADNIQFIADLTSSLSGFGIEVGIYTTKTYWANIMDNVEGYGQLKLWYPRYDQINSMDFATSILPFADFTKVYIKQTNGNVGACGITQVDSNYME